MVEDGCEVGGYEGVFDKSDKERFGRRCEIGLSSGSFFL